MSNDASNNLKMLLESGHTVTAVRDPIGRLRKSKNAEVGICIAVAAILIMLSLSTKLSLPTRWFCAANLPLLLASLLVKRALFSRVLRTGRMVYYFWSFGVAGVLIAWYLFLGSLLPLAATRYVSRGVLHAYVLLSVLAAITTVLFLERKAVPSLWKILVKSGRIDLDKGLFCPHIIAKGSSGSSGQSLAVLGASFGFIAMLFLRNFSSADTMYLFGGITGTVGWTFLWGIAWHDYIGIAIRIAKWERSSKKRLVIEKTDAEDSAIPPSFPAP